MKLRYGLFASVYVICLLAAQGVMADSPPFSRELMAKNLQGRDLYEEIRRQTGEGSAPVAAKAAKANNLPLPDDLKASEVETIKWNQDSVAAKPAADLEKAAPEAAPSAALPPEPESIEWRQVRTVNAQTAKERPSAPLPAARPSQEPIETLRLKQENAELLRKLQQAESRLAEKDLRPQPVAPQAAAPAVPAQAAAPAMRWEALGGADLQEVLQVWAKNAGAALYWDTEKLFATRDGLALSGSFEKAVEALLGQYINESPRPVATLYRDPVSSQQVLVIQSEK